MEMANTEYHIFSTFSFPILSARTPAGMPTAVCVMHEAFAEDNCALQGCCLFLRACSNHFILLTLHRSENVDDKKTLEMLMERLSDIKDEKIVFPIHPIIAKRFALALLQYYYIYSRRWYGLVR